VVPIQPCPPPVSNTPVVTTPAANVRFPTGSVTPVQSTTTDTPPEQGQSFGSSTTNPVPTPSIQSVVTYPPPTQVHESNDVAQFNQQRVAPPVIQRPPPLPVQRQPRIWHPPASAPIQHPPPPLQMTTTSYMSDAPISGIPQFKAIDTTPYPSYNSAPHSSQAQPLPMHQMHQDAPVSWTIPASLPPPQPPPPTFSQQPGHPHSVAFYNQGAPPLPTPTTYQSLPGSYPQPAGPSNQSIPGTDQQLFNVHDPYFFNGYFSQYP